MIKAKKFSIKSIYGMRIKICKEYFVNYLTNPME